MGSCMVGHDLSVSANLGMSCHGFGLDVLHRSFRPVQKGLSVSQAQESRTEHAIRGDIGSMNLQNLCTGCATFFSVLQKGDESYIQRKKKKQMPKDG